MTGGREPDDIFSDFLSRLALERAVEIVSTAAKALPQELRDREPEAPWGEIIEIGDTLRYGYEGARDDRMLNVLRVHLPKLRPAIVRLLAALEQGS